MKTFLASIGTLILLTLLAGAGFIYSGLYNIAADDPHWEVTAKLMETLRNRSIERRAREVRVPNLEDAQLVARGAGQYAAMCVNCHLAPGVQPNELSEGLYPAPPMLTKTHRDPRISYIAIKHGIKMTGMPAWGGPHGDEQVWSLVAFVSKLPTMTPQQYQELVRSPAANAAGAMAVHGSQMMPQAAGSPTPDKMPSDMHGPPGHDKPSALGQPR